MKDYDDIWEVTPETAHPKAQELPANSIIWDFGDSDSPLGNDTGADTFAAYLRYRTATPDLPIVDFVRSQLGVLGVEDRDWDVLDENSLAANMRTGGGLATIRRDDVIIAAAFAQLLIEGKIDEAVRLRAVTALRRESTDAVLSFRGGGGEEARKVQLADFIRILQRVRQEG